MPAVRAPGYQPLGVATQPVDVHVRAKNELSEFANRLDRFLGRSLETEASLVRQEGAAAGRDSGLSGTAPDAKQYGHSIAEQSFLRGAEEGYTRRLEINVRSKLDELAQKHGSDAAGFATDLQAYREGLGKEIPESFRPQFDAAFDTLARPRINEVGRLNQLAVAGERIASFDAAAQSRLSNVQRLARVADMDPDAHATLDVEIANHVRDLVALGPRTAFEFRGKKYEADPSRADALTPVEIEKRTKALENEATENAVLGAWSRSPRSLEWISAFEKREMDPKKGSGLTEEQVQKLSDRMRGEYARDMQMKRQAEADMRTQLGTAIDDDLAYLRTNGKPSGLVTEQQVAAAGYDMLDWKNKQAIARRGYEYDRQLALATPAEVTQMLADLKPAGTIGFEARQRAYEQFQQAVVKRGRAIETDPAAYVLSQSPALQEAWTQADRNPAAVRRAVSLSLELQAQLGVPEAARRVLPEKAAEGIVAQLQAVPPEKMADAMQEMGARYGDTWPRVYADLVRSKLPTEYTVLAGMSDPASRKLLAEAFQTEAKERGALQRLAGEDGKDVEIRVRKELAPLSNSLRAAPDGAAIVDRHATAAELLAYRYMQGGMSASDAARKAAGAVVLDRYTWMDGGGMAARIPKSASTDVPNQAATIRQTLKADDLDVPPARPGEILTDAQRADAYLQSTKRDGVWVTGPTDDRLILLDAARQPVRSKSGQPIEILFSAPFGQRNDGTAKGTGYYGPIKAADGSTMTELTVGVDIDGKQMEIPTLVPGLTRGEYDHLVKTGEPTDAIVRKAVDHARKRLADGKSPFAAPDERIPEPRKKPR